MPKRKQAEVSSFVVDLEGNYLDLTVSLENKGHVGVHISLDTSGDQTESQLRAAGTKASKAALQAALAAL